MVGSSLPVERPEGFHSHRIQPGDTDSFTLWAQRYQAVRFFRLGVVGLKHSREASQIFRTQVVQQLCLPAKSTRGDANRTDGMSDVVLAITVRAFAVFPGFSPVDRRKADEYGPLWKSFGEVAPIVYRKLGTNFESMLLRSVMADHWPLTKTFNRAADQVALRRVKVSTGCTDPRLWMFQC